MKAHEIEDMEGLVALLDAVFQQGPEPTREDTHERYKRACRLVYGVVRNAFDMVEGGMPALIDKACENMMDGSSLNSAAGGMILAATQRYLDEKIVQDRELFKKEFIRAVDETIESAARKLEEHHDACAKQSASKRTAQPLKTP